MTIRFKRTALVALSLLLVGLLLRPASASSNLQSRVVRLEFDLRSVQSQVSQLQSQLSRRGPPGRPAPPTDSAPAPTLNGPSLDEQFDNLAILVIEMRDQVRALESKVAELESR
ncbi:hypothetical protein IQ241_16625 [Romeria aff. gracilis LEGE 07310]|uniref:Uncharacterized protein n=1 Tax=Vasconcelosia minhoensis LEGE 07310 TaxID=915328 RepID=A0A8J7AYX6_9CYAN|nr:hypothetical protein [Romeria gracilis]MBE9078897.1 hypothetical protein [Romeria aff. gracilis LEGE 07310]